MLSVNMSDHRSARYISTLAWYHNGTRIVSGNKYSLGNSAMVLNITNMTESDAGTYEVKVDILCARDYISRLLESLAVVAPVKFTLQENTVPVYNPSSTVSTLYITKDSTGRIELWRDIMQFNPLSFRRVHNDWYRNGTQATGSLYDSSASNFRRLSLQIAYNSTDDAIGDYMGIAWATYFEIECAGIYNIYIVPLEVSLWTIKLYSTLTRDLAIVMCKYMYGYCSTL